jgi:hypothetical protein
MIIVALNFNVVLTRTLKFLSVLATEADILKWVKVKCLISGDTKMLTKTVLVSPLIIICVALLFVIGCETKAQTGTALGGLAGAGIGAVIGNQSGHAGTGALIGGAVGAGGGYMIGNEADKKQMNQQIQSAQQQADTVVVNITNSNGSITPVTLRRSGNVWIGPRGEQYMSVPTPEQLKPIYGM